MQIDLIEKCEQKLLPIFNKLDEICLYNQEKVLNAFQKNRIALRHFSGTSGYGYGDEGRDALNCLLADIFKAEKAVLSPSIVSGTHALSLCLYAILRANDTMLSVSGIP
ncbi:MAG: methionine gamma-lyase family protein, partial [Clostridia bacterium]|nr:methionine gamma-lyase family protein [Clostridia bacterium]